MELIDNISRLLGDDLTRMAVAATPEDERDFGVEGVG